ncbi:MAG: hypothetical protein ABI892_17735 [Flavobacterium sp.]
MSDNRILYIAEIDGDTSFKHVTLEIFPELSGYFYTKEGTYLGKMSSGNNVYITDQYAFPEIQKGKNRHDRVVFFTQKYELNNDQLLDRANWVYGNYENQSGKAFWETRKQPGEMTAQMKDAIAAVFKTQLFPETDPNNDSNQYRPDKENIV